MKKILVVVDMQNDFIDGPLGTPEARAIVDNVCAKIREGEWDRIFFTHDTHDENYLETQEGKKLPVKHCIQNTYGWRLNPNVEAASDDKDYDNVEFVDKITFGSVGLACKIDPLVWDDNITESDIELTLIGVCTDICVISNALLLKAHYPEMKIVVDAACCAGTTPEKHRMALVTMDSCQIEIENMPCDWVMLSDMKESTMARVLEALGDSEMED